MSIQEYLEEDSLDITNEDIGEFLISIITGGLYIEPHLILREYIQNSHDAIFEWEDAPYPGRVDIKIQPPNIHIIDNGPGMSREELIGAMSKVGISSKPFGAATGFMGIGKLAGLSMAERVRIDTSKHGEPGRNWVAFDAGEMLQAIEDRRRKGESRPIVDTLKDHSKLNRKSIQEDVNSHYTAVHLLGVNEDYWEALKDRSEFLKRLGLVSPVRQNPKFLHSKIVEEQLENISPEHYYPLNINVDSLPLFRPYTNEVSRPRELEIVDDEGNQLAYGWACLHNKSEQIPDALLRGIAIFQRGIAVGERSLAEELGLYGTTPSAYIYFRWYMGELYITDREILLTANRMSLRRNARALDFLERVKNEFSKLRNAASKFSQRDNAARKAPEHIELVQDVAQQVSEGDLSEEMVPSTVNSLVLARDDLKKRRRHLSESKQHEATDAIRKADELLQKLTTPATTDPGSQDVNVESESAATPSSTRLVAYEEEGITISEEETQEIISITERLNFTSREKQIFQIITEAIAEVSGGQETEEFARYLRKIDEFLSKRLRASTEDGTSL